MGVAACDSPQRGQALPELDGSASGGRGSEWMCEAGALDGEYSGTNVLKVCEKSISQQVCG